MRLYEWDGKALAEAATLEGNKGTVSAVAFSPDGSLLAAGDVSALDPGFMAHAKDSSVIWKDHSI